MSEPYEPPWERDREGLFAAIDYSDVATPAYLIHLEALQDNLLLLRRVQEATGCKMLLALKGFAAWRTFPLLRRHLDGVCASSVYEARLGREEFGKEVHCYAPTFSDNDISELLLYSDYLVFNSMAQWHRYHPAIEAYRRRSGRQIANGIRVNPQKGGQATALYNPARRGSRLGVTREAWDAAPPSAKVDLLHFHLLCEEDADALAAALAALEQKFGDLLPGLSAVNFGGGHHITRRGYDLELLCRLIVDFKAKHGVEVILEPGEAVALNAGVLVATVLDVVDNEGPIALLDTSAEAHMPDVLAMPYRPAVVGAARPGDKPYTYTLGGLSCLAGDVIGKYAFDKPLKAGDKVVFQNMAIYTMVKNNWFNGIRLPDICLYSGGRVVRRRHFAYRDYKGHLG